MAPSKPSKRNKKHKKSKHKQTDRSAPELAQTLLEDATSLLHSGQPDDALPVAERLLECLASIPDPLAKIPALELLGEIYVELGDPDQARQAFTASAALDPNGELPEIEGGGADKFLWLAQLSEDGGEDSIKWFEKGIKTLKRELDSNDGDHDDDAVGIKRRKLANALCGATEVYMTDLSWEDDAEAKCETFVTEACMVAPDTPEPLQTLASVRISQLRTDDARAALQRSMDLWVDLPPEDPQVPEFPTRISLVRLLMEVEMEEKAFQMLDRLVADDDNSVEAWYLGGWCLRLLANKRKQSSQITPNVSDEDAIEVHKLVKASKRWLKNSLRLYALLDYEDDRLHDHAEELITESNQELGLGTDADGEAVEDDDDSLWEDAGDSDADNGDEQMGNA